MEVGIGLGGDRRCEKRSTSVSLFTLPSSSSINKVTVRLYGDLIPLMDVDVAAWRVDSRIWVGSSSDSISISTI